MQETAEFTDLTLACSDGVVHAHKAMLARVIKQLEESIDCVIIPGVAVAEVEEALQELYLQAEPTKLRI